VIREVFKLIEEIVGQNNTLLLASENERFILKL